MLFKNGGAALNLIDLSEEELQPLKNASDRIDLERILKVIEELSETEGQLRWAENPRIIMEVAAVKLCSDIPVYQNPSNDILAGFEMRLQQLEGRISQIQQGVNLQPVHPDKKAKPAKKITEKSESEEEKIPAKTESDPNFAGEKYRLSQWPHVIEYIRSENRMKVYAYLLDTWCFISDDGTANVVVQGDDALKKTVLSRKDSLEIIEDAISHVLGRDMKVKIIEENNLGSAASENEADPVLEKIMKFATENNIPLKIEE